MYAGCRLLCSRVEVGVAADVVHPRSFAFLKFAENCDRHFVGGLHQQGVSHARLKPFERLLTDIVSFPAPTDVDGSNRFQPSKNSRTYRRCLSTIRNPVIFRAVYSTTLESHWSSVTCRNGERKHEEKHRIPIKIIHKSFVRIAICDDEK